MKLKLHDLSHPLRIGTQGFPGCGRIVGWPMKEIVGSNYNMLHVSTDLHTGTHLDAMLHCVEGGTDAAGLSLMHCVGPAVVVDLRHRAHRGAQFTVADFRPAAAAIRDCGKVLVKTGWARHWETPAYHDDFPGFAAEAARFLVDLGIHLVGVEQASVHPSEHLAVHRIFFDHQVIIVEGLANLEQVPVEQVELFAAPLRFEGADGSLIRAFCRY